MRLWIRWALFLWTRVTIPVSPPEMPTRPIDEWSSLVHCTRIRWSQFLVVWSQTSLAHHWIGRKRSRPLGTNGAMYWIVSSILCISSADIDVATRQWWIMDWTLTRIFGRGATVKPCVLNLIPMKSNSCLGISSDFSRFMIHPRWRSMVITSCAWEFANCGESAQISQSSKYTRRTPCIQSNWTTGRRILVNSLGEVSRPSGRRKLLRPVVDMKSEIFLDG